MTQTHTVDNLYTFITNSRKMDDLDAQIKQKVDLLKHLEQLEKIYEDLGKETMLDKTTECYNRVLADILTLQLRRNKLEREILMFQLKALFEE